MLQLEECGLPRNTNELRENVSLFECQKKHAPDAMEVPQGRVRGSFASKDVAAIADISKIESRCLSPGLGLMGIRNLTK